MASKRIVFKHGDQVVYEWEQSLEEVNIYINPPPGITAKALDIRITVKHLYVGIKGNPPFLNEDLGSDVLVEESYWMLEDGELHINLQKMRKGEVWPCVLKGHAELDQLTTQEVQKKVMLERFQEEHPGFDFSGAEFNGMAPDPREFMGGVKYK